MRVLLIAILIILPFELISRVPLTTISGNVVGFDGKPMKLAQVHFTPSGVSSKHSTSFFVNNNGTYSVEMPNGWYMIYFTGINHQSAPKLPFRIYCCGEPVTVNAQLEGNIPPTKLDSVHVITDLTKYSFEDGIKMTKQKDGTFSAEVKTNAKELGYQVIMFGANKDGEDEPLHSINGTMNEKYIYDKGGDYRSSVPVKNGIAKIVFNPTMLPTIKVNSSVTIQDDFSKQVKSITEQEAKDNQSYYTAFYQKRQGKPTDYNPKVIRDRIKELAEKTTNQNLKQCYQLCYLKVNHFSIDSSGADANYVTSILASIPPSSALWENSPTTIMSAIRMSSDTNSNYAQKVLEQNTSAYVKAEVLYAMLQKAVATKDAQLQRELYYNLTKNYPEMYAAKRAEKEFNPDKQIIVGKTIPNFSFQGIEEQNGTVITPATLKGKWILIDNWATWCGPCVAEMPELHKTYQKFKDKNFTILSVSYDRKATDVTKFRNGKWKMPWLHCFSEGVWENEAAKIFEASGIPKPILIDPTGKIIALENELRGVTLEETIGRFVK